VSGWVSVKLGDIATLHYGKALKSEDRIFGNVPVYSSAGLTGYHDEALVKSKGLIIGRKGTVGKVYRSDTPFCCIDTAYFVLPDETEYDFDYLYFLLQTLGLDDLNEDSAVPGLNRETAYSQQFLLPSIEEQKAIASVLSSLDDKIDLLHRQNTILESMAQTLFRQWFVEEAQEDWEEYKVSDFAEHLKQGINPAQNPFVEYHHYSLPAFDESQRPVFELGSDILSNKYRVLENTILVSKLNPRFPRIWAIQNLPSINSVCSTEFQVFKPKQDNLYAYLYFLFGSSQARDALEMAASGTSGSHQRVRPEDMLNITTQLPSIGRAIEFSEVTQAYIEKITANRKQIQTLEKLRDDLLPKLISGEVRVTQ
jgi:type I restriction enzyme S subunit